ncbi:hypothetical protein EC968_007719 [Mortierella alpina]|nr:hypothetical protein EC968_007719 [Mortierella alpina]
MTLSSPTSGNKYASEANEAIDSHSDSLRELSLQIHDNPELGYEEVIAHRILTDYLEDKGFKITRGAYGIKTAFVAVYESPAAIAAAASGKKVKTIGFCSEYDALPGIGHACGHNLIAIAGVAAALGVKAVLQKHNLEGRIRLVGTPAEETTGGKIPLIEKGAFDGMDACIMTHPAPGDVVYVTILSVGGVLVKYHGKASHASASPWEGVNALDAMVTAYNGIGLLRQQTAPTSRVHCIITKGGEAANSMFIRLAFELPCLDLAQIPVELTNSRLFLFSRAVIPDYAEGKILYRATNAEDHKKIEDSVHRILHAAAESTGCTVEIIKEMAYQSVPHNELLAARYAQYTTDLGVKYPSRAAQEAAPSGSTDMGNVAHHVPAIHPVYNLSSLDSVIDTTISNHSIAFTAKARTEVAHLATLRSAKGLALTGLDVVLEEGFSEAVRDEFERTVRKSGVSTLKHMQSALAAVSGGGCGCH